jgi:preprotein translocase subunit SecA
MGPRRLARQWDLYATNEPITPRGAGRGGRPDREALVDEFREDARGTTEKEKARPEPETDQPLLRDVERFVISGRRRPLAQASNMYYLRECVHLRVIAQKDPLVEYTSEGHRMFEELNAAIREEVVMTLFHAEIEVEEAGQLQQAQAAQALDGGGFAYEHESLSGSQAIAAAGAGTGTLLAGDGASVTAGGIGAGGGSVATTGHRRARRTSAGTTAGAAAAVWRATAPDATYSPHPKQARSDDHRACAGSTTGTSAPLPERTVVRPPA